MKCLLLLAFGLFFGQVSNTYAFTASKQIESISATQCYWEYGTVVTQIGNAWAAIHDPGDPWGTWTCVAAQVLSETQSTVEMVNALEALGCGPEDIQVALDAIDPY